MQLPVLRRINAQNLRQHLFGVRTQHRRGASRHALRTGEVQGQSGHEQRTHTGLLDLCEQRVGGGALGVAGHKLFNALIAVPAHAMALQGRCHIGIGACRNPAAHQCRQLTPRLEAVAFSGQLETELRTQRVHFSANAHAFANAAPLLAGEAHQHHPHAVGAGKVTAKGTEQLVAMARAGLAQLGLANEAQVLHHRQPDIGQRQLHMLALATALPVPLGRQQAHGHHLPGHQVPGRQHMVHRLGHGLGSGELRHTDHRVDGVVHRRAAMAVALQGDLDQVLALGLQGLMVQPAARRKIGDEHAGIGPGRGDERLRDLATLFLRQVQHHRALGLVQATPEQAHALVRHRPAPVVEPAARRVDADHVGPHLRQGHATQRCRHEGRRLHHAHARQNTWKTHDPLTP